MKKKDTEVCTKDEIIRFRMTKEEKEIVVQKSSKKGLNLSAYLRGLIEADISMNKGAF